MINRLSNAGNYLKINNNT
jgi:GTP-binding protein LepA